MPARTATGANNLCSIFRLEHITGAKIQKEIYEGTALELHSTPPLVDLSLLLLGIVPEDCHIIHHTEGLFCQ